MESAPVIAIRNLLAPGRTSRHAVALLRMTAQSLVEIMDVAGASQAAATSPSALFLHTAWRSSGTWLWAALRDDPAVMAFYEPLHEQLATLNAARIARLGPAQWNSGHAGEAPYYSEFAELILRRGRGVKGYQERFAADRYFLEEDSQDAALAGYLGQLLDHAEQAGRVPVLKFCRSLGRVAWMQRHFPTALHAVVLRDPRAQWRSARLQLAQADNRYFLVGPLLIMARNARHPLVAEALARLDVTLPALPAHGSLAFDQEICWRHLVRQDWAQRYRGFLAYWTASAIAALQPGTLLIDSDELIASPAHRERVQNATYAALGVTLPLPTRPPTPAALDADPAEREAMARAHADAIGLLQSQGGSLPEASFSRVLEKLAPASASGWLGRAAAVRQACTPVSGWRQALYFSGLRLSMPLRRLHGSTRRLLPK